MWQNMPENFFRGEWEFLKLFVGLNGASIGGWFFAQDKLVYSRFTASIFANTILMFAVSMGFCLYTIRLLVDLEQHSIHTGLETPRGETVVDNEYVLRLRKYASRLNISLATFGLGYAQAAILILINLTQKHMG